VFITKNVCDTGYSKIVKEAHIRFVLKQNNTSITGIGFNMSDKFPLLQTNHPIDIVYTIDENEYNGNTTLQLKVIDIRFSEN
ncbi:MAG: single-stranded-DNA-specific exonuclease RecJ, partial [Bacteroidota bacterium]